MKYKSNLDLVYAVAAIAVWAVMLMFAAGLPVSAIFTGVCAALAGCAYVTATGTTARPDRPKEVGDRQWERWATTAATEVDGSGLSGWSNGAVYEYLAGRQSPEEFEQALDRRCGLDEYAHKETLEVEREVEQMRTTIDTIWAMNRYDQRARHRAEAMKRFIDAEQQARISGCRIKTWRLTPAEMDELRRVWDDDISTILGHPVMTRWPRRKGTDE